MTSRISKSIQRNQIPRIDFPRHVQCTPAGRKKEVKQNPTNRFRNNKERNKKKGKRKNKTHRSDGEANPARLGPADGKEPAHDGPADELGEDLDDGDRGEEAGVVGVVDEGGGEALQGGLGAFA